MSNTNNIPEEVMTVTLTLDDNSVVECEVITIYEADGKDYIALLPLNENGESESGDVYLYRYFEENGEPTLENIEDDEEYEIQIDYFSFNDVGKIYEEYVEDSMEEEARENGSSREPDKNQYIDKEVDTSKYNGNSPSIGGSKNNKNSNKGGRKDK